MPWDGRIVWTCWYFGFLFSTSLVWFYHGFQVEIKFNVFSLAVCPEDGIISSAPDEDGEGDDDQMEGIKDCGIYKISQKDSILCYWVLNGIENKDKQNPNDKLGDDEEKVDS